ncbi:MAG TPA: CarD family transcriptional regulator, partial [Deltaproteobacteria bacterium]|nr:CarD family transcriptional regulator [Deltaproteobacteria bacterium]
MGRSILDYLSCTPAVGFVPASLQALVAACILRKTGRPVLWVVESVEAMEQAEDDLATFLGTERVMPFPPYDVRPYQDDSPSREVMARRISTLYGLLCQKAAVVVVPVQALCCYTLPAGDLSEALIHIRTDMEIDRDELAAGLVRMGYTREALVDDVGQFSIRGSVMDIFSPGMDEPVRLDLFGDEVKVLKSFDVRTQRTSRTLTTATVLPAGEVLLDSRHVRTARPLMRMRLKDRLRFAIEDMEQGIRTPGIESFLVLFFERPCTLFDYLPLETVILAPDPVEAGMLWDEVHTSFAHGYERALSLDRPALPPEDTLMTREDLLQRMERFSRRVSTSAASLDGPLASSVLGMGPTPGKAETAFDRILSQTDAGMDVFVFTASDMLAERVEYSLQTRGVAIERTDSEFLMRHAGFSGRVRLIEGNLSSGFILPGMGVALVSAEELLGARRRKRKGPSGPPIYDPFTQLSVGDAVVHRDKGIGLFQGVVRLEVDGTTSDYVLLEYLGGDRLYVPVYNLSLLQRYVGDVDHYTVDRLGGTRWVTARAKAQKSVAKLAGELLHLYAKRQAATGFAF